MKKFSRLLIALLIAFATIQVVPVYAKSVPNDTYPMAQSEKNFEVALVENSGNFNYLAAFDTFDEAKAYMEQSGERAVVRAADSVKQTKIVAMNSGVAYSCRWEDGGTVSLNSTSSNATGYMSSYRQIYYLETESYTGNGHGRVKANLGGFECYVDLDVIELIPYVYITQGVAIFLADDLHVIPQVASYKVVVNGNYRDLVFTSYGIYEKNGGSAPVVTDVAVGPAADWMETGKTYYSMDDVNFYNDMLMNDKAGVYYNYYQFMPLRTKSSIPSSVYNGFLQSKGYGTNSVLYNTGESFVKAQNDYGVNALMVFAQACLESAYGTSYYAKSRNNLFGLGAYDSNPDNAYQFDSVYECLELQMGYYLRNYFYADSSLFFGAHYGNKGSGISVKYASDPYYGQKISSIAYAIDKYANNYSGNLMEYNSCTTGVITTYEAEVKGTAGGNTIYTTEYRKGYQMNNTVVILSEEGDYYKIQSDNYLKENGYCLNVLIDSDLRIYDWDYNVGYIRKSDVSIISSNTVINPPKDELTKIGEVTVNVTGLRIRTAPTTASSFVGYAQDGMTYDVYSITEQGGYTWYQIDQNQYIADNGSWVTYVKNGEQKPQEPQEPEVPEVPVEPENPQQPEEPETPVTPEVPENPGEVEQPGEEEEKPSDETVDPDKISIISSVSDICYNDDKSILHIEGKAYLRGISAKNESDVTHTVVLVDLESGEETEFSATTSCLDEPKDMNDGYTYLAIVYKSDIDMEDIEIGEYALKIRVSNRGYEDERYIISNRITELETVKNEDGSIRRVYPNSIYSNRFEISISYDSIDYSTINKPTSRYSKRVSRNFAFNNGKLTFDGYAFIYKANMSEEDQPDYSIVLQDQNGRQYVYKANNTASAKDYSKIFGYTQDLSFADYNASILLSDLPVGTYRMYITISNNTYSDIEELFSYSYENINSYEYNEKTYSLKTSNVHGRFILEVNE